MAIFPPPPGASTTKVGTAFFISCKKEQWNQSTAPFILSL
ncbi:hypothetical protein CHCC19466_1388 [Bacillus licheniformis]|nr:hypothetical protein CHCC20373_2447 [Bacillus licheniformis]TWL15930.1 hypothetical protein CHCC19466_1388 [Bacillus licheniformis]TWL92145.1 hypothetical protein CHCC15291_1454 [Bacillus licheniformis]TWL95321.1 hypothetical protein CHCC15289_3749 [Bacillus licheniformis]